MADNKYGQLFTAQDLSNIVTVAMQEGTDEGGRLMDGALSRAMRTVQERVGLAFPPDEPLFLIRGHDQAAPAAVQGYHDAAEFNGAEKAFCEDVLKSLIDVVGWQTANPDKVKVPD